MGKDHWDDWMSDEVQPFSPPPESASPSDDEDGETLEEHIRGLGPLYKPEDFPEEEKKPSVMDDLNRERLAGRAFSLQWGWIWDLWRDFGRWIWSWWTPEFVYGLGRLAFALVMVGILVAIGYHVFSFSGRPKKIIHPQVEELLRDGEKAPRKGLR